MCHIQNSVHFVSLFHIDWAAERLRDTEDVVPDQLIDLNELGCSSGFLFRAGVVDTLRARGGWITALEPDIERLHFPQENGALHV